MCFVWIWGEKLSLDKYIYIEIVWVLLTSQRRCRRNRKCPVCIHLSGKAMKRFEQRWTISSHAEAIPRYKPLLVMESPSPEKVHRWSVSTHRCPASAAGGKHKQSHSGALRLQDRDSDRKLSLRQFESLRAWVGEDVEKIATFMLFVGM